MSDVFKLMGVYAKTTAKSWFQYRVDAVLKSLAVFLREATGIIVIWFTLLKFDQLNGWDIYEMLFLFSLLFLTYGIMIIFFTGSCSAPEDCCFRSYLSTPTGLRQSGTAAWE